MIQEGVLGVVGAKIFSSFKRLVNREGALDLAFHAGIHTLATGRDVGLDKLEIILVADDDVALADGLQHRGRNVARAARPDAGYDDAGYRRHN